MVSAPAIDHHPNVSIEGFHYPKTYLSPTVVQYPLQVFQQHPREFFEGLQALPPVDEVRKAEFFRQGPKKRGLIRGKRWLLLSRWKNLTTTHRGELNQLFGINRRVFKAYLMKESLETLWNYSYEGAMLNYLKKWIDQLRCIIGVLQDMELVVDDLALRHPLFNAFPEWSR